MKTPSFLSPVRACGVSPRYIVQSNHSSFSVAGRAGSPLPAVRKGCGMEANPCGQAHGGEGTRRPTPETMRKNGLYDVPAWLKKILRLVPGGAAFSRAAGEGLWVALLFSKNIPKQFGSFPLVAASNAGI